VRDRYPGPPKLPAKAGGRAETLWRLGASA
jgi:hypothetical protein